VNLYLREVKRSDKEELLKMVEEIKNDVIPDKFEGFRIIENLTNDNFDDFLIELEHNKTMKSFRPEWVDQTTFILVDDNDHIYGGTNVRHELNYELFNYGDHVGYLIRPSERRKGYGTLILKLALNECKKLGINHVLLTCREDNIGSAKVIENNNGIYEGSKYQNNIPYRRYWISI
jgi:predicted acetyltransferase